jgi:hypothetical protein
VKPRMDATETNRVVNSCSLDRGQGKSTPAALDTYHNFQLRFTDLEETTLTEFIRKRAGPSLCAPSDRLRTSSDRQLRVTTESNRELRRHREPRLGIQFMARHFMGLVVAASVIFRRIEYNAGINLTRLGYRRQILIFFREEHMKRFAQYLSGLVLGLGLTFSALPGHALDSVRVNVTVPFDFTVGDNQLKAGDYIIESLLNKRVMMLRSKGGDVQQVVLTVPIEAPTKPTIGNHEHLLFLLDGDRYSLSQVWFHGDEGGRELTLGGHEKRPETFLRVSDQVIVGQ